MTNISTTDNASIEDFALYIGTNWNFGLLEACKRGRLDLAKFMIEKGANDWNRGMSGACRSGKLELANLMIQKGANDWNRGMYDACTGGHLDLAGLMISNGADNLDSCMYSACRGGHLDLAGLMIEKGASDWNWGIQGACWGGHLDLVNLMISKGADNWNLCLAICMHTPVAIKCAKQMISKGADNLERLRDSTDAFLYRMYCQHYADHDVVRLRELIRSQDPLYFLMIHKHDKSVPVNALPMDLLRYCKSFLD